MSKNGFDALMQIACVEWGFCGCVKQGEHLHVTMLIPSCGPVHADQFVEWLLLADDVNPNAPDYARHKTALRAAFLHHMGGEVVDAALLRWDDMVPDMEGSDHKYRGLIPD